MTHRPGRLAFMEREREKVAVFYLICFDESFNDWGGWGGLDDSVPGDVTHQNSPCRGYDYMVPYMVSKAAPNKTPFTRGLVKCIHGRGYFRAVPS